MRALKTSKFTACLLSVGLLAAAAGCETIQDNPKTAGTLGGAAAGAGLGTLVAGKGNKTEGAIIGGVLGGVGGNLGGRAYENSRDKNDDRDLDRARRASDWNSDRDYRYDSDRYDRYDTSSDRRYDSRDRY